MAIKKFHYTLVREFNVFQSNNDGFDLEGCIFQGLEALLAMV
jgi:hypothetical protein